MSYCEKRALNPGILAVASTLIAACQIVVYLDGTAGRPSLWLVLAVVSVLSAVFWATMWKRNAGADRHFSATTRKLPMA